MQWCALVPPPERIFHLRRGKQWQAGPGQLTAISLN
jgi:hypothetical protein